VSKRAPRCVVPSNNRLQPTTLRAATEPGRWADQFTGMEESMKQPYEKPAIIHTERIEARAVVCGKAEPVACTPFGPVTS